MLGRDQQHRGRPQSGEARDLDVAEAPGLDVRPARAQRHDDGDRVRRPAAALRRLEAVADQAGDGVARLDRQREVTVDLAAEVELDQGSEGGAILIALRQPRPPARAGRQPIAQRPPQPLRSGAVAEQRAVRPRRGRTPAAERRPADHRRRLAPGQPAALEQPVPGAAVEAPVGAGFDQHAPRLVVESQGRGARAGGAPQLDDQPVGARDQPARDLVAIEAAVGAISAGADPPLVEPDDVLAVAEDREAGARRNALELELARHQESAGPNVARIGVEPEKGERRSPAVGRAHQPARPGAALGGDRQRQRRDRGATDPQRARRRARLRHDRRTVAQRRRAD